VKEVTCKNCGYMGGEDFSNQDGTHTCPKCKSRNVHIHPILRESISLHEKLGIKARHPGQRKPFKEVLVGDDLFRKFGKWMRKRRVIDREKDQYEELVVDPETGKTVNRCSEKLSNHKGHGSAKKRKQ